MKKILPLLALFLFITVCMNAQTSYSYYFNNNLHGTNGAPDLIAQCGSPTYGTHDFSVIGGGVRPVFNITANCGLLFADNGNFLKSGSYTIAMYVWLANTSGYRKLIDYKNLQTDAGLYDYSGEYGFYNSISSFSGVILSDSTYFLAVITRDSASSRVNMYANGQYIDGYPDTSSLGFYDAHKFLYFLTDDSATTIESCTGQIAMLRIFNYALDSAAAVHQNQPGSLLSVSAVASDAAQWHVYPNPVSSILHIAIDNHHAPADVEVYSIEGALVLQSQTDNSGDIAMGHLPIGMYVVKVSAEGASAYYKVMKQ